MMLEGRAPSPALSLPDPIHERHGPMCEFPYRRSFSLRVQVPGESIANGPTQEMPIQSVDRDSHPEEWRNAL